MHKLNPTHCFIISLFIAISIYACTDKSSSSKHSFTSQSLEIKKWITTGNRVSSGKNDSLLIVANKLRDLQKTSGDSSALVYAELYEANYYWQNANHAEAMRRAIKCLADAEKYNVRPAMSEIYGTIANLHKETTNFDMAFKAADKGLAISRKDKDTARIIAFLGLQAMFSRSLNLNQHRPGPDKSIGLNLAALQMAESNPKYERLRTRFYDNICQYYKDQRDFEKAHYYGEKGVANAIKNNQQRSLTYAYSWLGQTNFFEGNYARGLDLLDKAKQIAIQLKEPYREMEINEHFFDCYRSVDDYKTALKFYTRARFMRDSLKVLDNVKQIGELQLKYETAQKDKKIAVLNAGSKLRALQRNMVFIVLILLVIIATLFYLKERKRKQLLMSEQQRLNEELKSAGLELLYFTENLKQKNELIEGFKAEIEQLQSADINADKTTLDNVLKAHIMTDDNWDSFKNLFTKVHTGFFETLKQKYPNLTATDWKILSLIKLQLSNSEMANMLGITIEGIKKSKQRLRKKMELNKDENLEKVIEAF